MASLGNSAAPVDSYKKAGRVKKIGKNRRSGYLRMRMRADDSAAVCVSDNKLGRGISNLR